MTHVIRVDRDRRPGGEVKLVYVVHAGGVVGPVVVLPGAIRLAVAESHHTYRQRSLHIVCLLVV